MYSEAHIFPVSLLLISSELKMPFEWEIFKKHKQVLLSLYMCTTSEDTVTWMTENRVKRHDWQLRLTRELFFFFAPNVQNGRVHILVSYYPFLYVSDSIIATLQVDEKLRET